ncbi:protein of unknown function (plasmid) [Thiomonas sp. Bio17B3]|nr:protein of unknown function [Thiomonas sp. Sup16B3]VDY11315.1 protein of unknown function [Thiomonas sp. Bio17B3]
MATCVTQPDPFSSSIGDAENSGIATREAYSTKARKSGSSSCVCASLAATAAASSADKQATIKDPGIDSRSATDVACAFMAA